MKFRLNKNYSLYWCTTYIVCVTHVTVVCFDRCYLISNYVQENKTNMYCNYLCSRVLNFKRGLHQKFNLGPHKHICAQGPSTKFEPGHKFYSHSD